MTIKDVTPIQTALCPICRRLRLANKKCLRCFPAPVALYPASSSVFGSLYQDPPPPGPAA